MDSTISFLYTTLRFVLLAKPWSLGIFCTCGNSQGVSPKLLPWSGLSFGVMPEVGSPTCILKANEL